jgi:hypothetical protein
VCYCHCPAIGGFVLPKSRSSRKPSAYLGEIISGSPDRRGGFVSPKSPRGPRSPRWVRFAKIISLVVGIHWRANRPITHANGHPPPGATSYFIIGIRLQLIGLFLYCQAPRLAHTWTEAMGNMSVLNFATGRQVEATGSMARPVDLRFPP